MSADPLLPHVRALLAERIESVAQLDLLLFMRRRSDKIWSAAEAASELRIGLDWALDQLRRLTERGFLRLSGTSFQYAAPSELDDAVSDLARAYQVFPVTIVAAIYPAPPPNNAQLRQFSDAFRLRPGGQGPQGG